MQGMTWSWMKNWMDLILMAVAATDTAAGVEGVGYDMFVVIYRI